MPVVALEAAQADLVRAGLRASVASISWTLCASGAAGAIGVASHSIALVAFGAVGLCDGAGSTALVAHFRNALRHEAISDRYERRAHRIVIVGLLIVGFATSVASVVRLVGGGHTHEPIVGVAISAASIVVLAGLGGWKRQLGKRIPSHALLADSSLSFVGSFTASVTVLGTALDSTLGWWWMDPAAALAVGIGAVLVATQSARKPLQVE